MSVLSFNLFPTVLHSADFYPFPNQTDHPFILHTLPDEVYELILWQRVAEPCTITIADPVGFSADDSFMERIKRVRLHPPQT